MSFSTVFSLPVLLRRGSERMAGQAPHSQPRSTHHHTSLELLCSHHNFRTTVQAWRGREGGRTKILVLAKGPFLRFSTRSLCGTELTFYCHATIICFCKHIFCFLTSQLLLGKRTSCSVPVFHLPQSLSPSPLGFSEVFVSPHRLK